jgi:hypothetical protein
MMMALGCGVVGLAAAKGNPFEVIVARNVFRLLPFPAPHIVVKETPPKVLPKVVVTGITDVCGRREVLAEITEVGKPVMRPVLGEGETVAGVEVVSIDVEQGRVRFRVLGEESEMTWQAARRSAAPPAEPVLAVRR